MSFKVGDKVVCIDNFFREKTLTLGKIYTITHAYKGEVFLAGSRVQWGISANRFRLANPIECLMEIVNDQV